MASSASRRPGPPRPRPRPRPVVARRLRHRPDPAHRADVASSASSASRREGHVVTTILIGMVAMLFTAISYGRMAARLPERRLGLRLRRPRDPPGARLRDGLEHDLRLRDEPDHLRDLVQQGGRELPARLPFAVWAIFFARPVHGAEPARHQGQRAHQRRDRRGLGVVIVLFLVRRVSLPLGRARSTARPLARPFYDPATFSWAKVSTGTASPCSPTSASTGSRRCRRRRRTRAATSCWRPSWSASSPGVARASLQVYPRSSSGRTVRASRTSTPPSSTWPAGPAGPVLFAIVNLAAARRQRRLRDGRAPRRRPPALRHGPRQRHPAPLLRRAQPAHAHPEQQHHPRRRARARRGLHSSATASAPSC